MADYENGQNHIDQSELIFQRPSHLHIPHLLYLILPCRDLTVVLSYNIVKRPTFTAVLILRIDFGNIADVLTGWWHGHGKMPNIQNPKKFLLTMLPWIVGQPTGQCESPRTPWDNTDQQMICWDRVAYAHWSVLLDPTSWRLQYILQLLERTQVSMLLAVPKTIVATWVSSITCPVVGLLVVVLNTSISTNGRILYSAWPIHQGVPSERWDEPHALVNKLTLSALSSIWWTSSTPSHPHLRRAPFSNSTTGARASSTTQENLRHDGWVTNLISAVVCE